MRTPAATVEQGSDAYMFQSLVGAMRTLELHPAQRERYEFQSLVGAMRTHRRRSDWALSSTFQSLVGAMRTSLETQLRFLDIGFNPS